METYLKALGADVWFSISLGYKALKLSECGWGWPVTDELDLGWIHMHTMLINDVA